MTNSPTTQTREINAAAGRKKSGRRAARKFRCLAVLKRSHYAIETIHRIDRAPAKKNARAPCASCRRMKGGTSHTEKCDVWARKMIAKANLHSSGEAVDSRAFLEPRPLLEASISSGRKKADSTAMPHGLT